MDSQTALEAIREAIGAMPEDQGEAVRVALMELRGLVGRLGEYGKIAAVLLSVQIAAERSTVRRCRSRSLSHSQSERR